MLFFGIGVFCDFMMFLVICRGYIWCLKYVVENGCVLYLNLLCEVMDVLM